ncbi:GNAT family N-acetyltransferase [Nocardioides taihuensis]|uniref:GNAT family N-acetyltransferase n=1 Tax=Nocardioides taihuensis TaxID=1835606 RepID=A0ABW0BKQ1_9ACTN
MPDHRVAAVEDNLLDFFGSCADLPVLTREPWDDVAAYCSPVPFPLFNGITGARFAPGQETDRARAVLERYVARGLPALWWTTPSTSSPALERVLVEHGWTREDVPGMHLPVAALVDRPPLPGVGLTTVDLTRSPEPFVSTMLAGFGMPPELAGDFGAVFGHLDPDRCVNVVATVDGEPAATATGWRQAGTIGVYNVATVTDHRGRGLGSAITAAVVAIGRERGDTDAVLHASEMGRPVYERMGFAAVCTVPQFVWLPS